MSDSPFRTIKAILKTAFAWGFVLGAVSGVLIGGYVLIFAGPGVESLPERIGEALFAGVGMGTRFAVAGFVLGTFFATLLRLSFRGKRIADLHPGKFALIGAVVGGVGIPLFYQFLNVISGGPIPWSLLTDDIVWAAIVGGAGAASTIWIARRAAVGSGEGEAALLGEGNPFGDGATIKGKDRAPVER
jgi:hypothetical protein